MGLESERLMGIGMRGWNECGCDHTYYLREYQEIKKEYDRLSRLVEDLIEADNLDHCIEREEDFQKALARLHGWKMRGTSQPSIKKTR